MAEKKKKDKPVEYEHEPQDYAWDKVYLVNLDDGADNWPVIVFANGKDRAIAIAKEAYEAQQGEPTEAHFRIGVSRVKPPYFWVG
jgi:hypothetical protein